MDFNLQKQYSKIPQKFKVKTVLFTRLDLNVEDVLKFNFHRKEIAKMKQIINSYQCPFSSLFFPF